MNKPVAIKNGKTPVAIADAEWEAGKIEKVHYFSVLYICDVSTQDNIIICGSQTIHARTQKQCKAKVEQFFKLNKISKWRWK